MVIYRPLALTLTVSIDNGGNGEFWKSTGDQIKVTQTDVVESNTHEGTFTHSFRYSINITHYYELHSCIYEVMWMGRRRAHIGFDNWFELLYFESHKLYIYVFGNSFLLRTPITHKHTYSIPDSTKVVIRFNTQHWFISNSDRILFWLQQ